MPTRRQRRQRRHDQREAIDAVYGAQLLEVGETMRYRGEGRSVRSVRGAPDEAGLYRAERSPGRARMIGQGAAPEDQSEE
jgi:hypothetical protein